VGDSVDRTSLDTETGLAPVPPLGVVSVVRREVSRRSCLCYSSNPRACVHVSQFDQSECQGF
jgi:hypothetical protein